MIINFEALENYYPLNLDRIIADTWFISENDVCCFNLPKIQTNNSDDEQLKILFSLIKRSAEYYSTFKVNELGISYEAPPNWFQRLSYYLPTNGAITYRTLMVDRKADLENAAARIEESKINNWHCIDMSIFSNFSIYDINRNIVEQEMVGIKIYIQYTNLRDTKACFVFKKEECSDYRCSLYIGMKNWSLLRKSNDLDILMIYLFSCDLLTTEAQLTSELEIEQLLNLGQIDQIVRAVKSRGKICVSSKKYEFYEYCVLVLSDTGIVPFQGNDELASINRTRFSSFIRQLENHL